VEAFILHHYWASPFAQKVRSMLAFKGIPWSSVEISPVLPRASLMRLTGGYRRSPVLQLGADVFCDSRAIAQELERRVPEPTLFPPGSRPLIDLLQGWAEPGVFPSTGLVRIQTEEDLRELWDDTVSPEAFVADRAGFMRPVFEIARASELTLSAEYQLSAFLRAIAGLLEDGRPYLAGNLCSLADFAAYPCFWWLASSRRCSERWLGDARLMRWGTQMQELGDGKFEGMTDARALEIAAAATPRPPLGSAAVEREHEAPTLGQPFYVQPADYGCEPVFGELYELSRDRISLWRRDAVVGTLVTHLPTVGFRFGRLPSLPALEA